MTSTNHFYFQCSLFYLKQKLKYILSAAWLNLYSMKIKWRNRFHFQHTLTISLIFSLRGAAISVAFGRLKKDTFRLGLSDTNYQMNFLIERHWATGICLMVTRGLSSCLIENQKLGNFEPVRYRFRFQFQRQLSKCQCAGAACCQFQYFVDLGKGNAHAY